MISVSTEERQIAVAVTTEPKTVHPPAVSTQEGSLSPPALTVSAASAIEVRVVRAAPISGAATYTHVQSTPAAVWTIPNPFGVPCAAVTVKDASGHTVLASVYDDVAVIVIDFPQPFAGSAYLIRS